MTTATLARPEIFAAACGEEFDADTFVPVDMGNTPTNCKMPNGGYKVDDHK